MNIDIEHLNNGVQYCVLRRVELVIRKKNIYPDCLKEKSNFLRRSCDAKMFAGTSSSIISELKERL